VNTPNDNIEKDYTTGNNIQLVLSGKNYFDLLLQIIDTAKKVLHLQFYIFLNDQTGITVMEALKAAARRNVAVFLHIDSYASKELPQLCINDMRAAGVKVKLFEPLLRSRHFYFGRRLHHKVVVADGSYSLVGGINVCDRYNDMPGVRYGFVLRRQCSLYYRKYLQRNVEQEKFFSYNKKQGYKKK
jgi:cardiolipin synthase A/B